MLTLNTFGGLSGSLYIRFNIIQLQNKYELNSIIYNYFKHIFKENNAAVT